jgi:hypothetical protein
MLLSFPDELQQLAERLQDAYAGPSRTQHGPGPHHDDASNNAKRQVTDLPLLVEVRRLELPYRLCLGSRA